MTSMKCLRCGQEMRFLSQENIQLGRTGWLLGDLPNLVAGALSVDIFVCPDCRKLEFYASEECADESELPQKTCPECGCVQDFDTPKCPKCKYDWYA